ncbi:putative NAD(+) ADP-ribosyltransferase [Lupinus albus]|uniref:Putative NAD(+) ADP-ribosyltransferase n=1 Tax=Lupinus albus TaxID=3870 RepID=A0A6A4NDI2_LUPAL|nr:putative NAD(+) ADP-ribosyltransferase [Lupinus albus]
MVKTKQKLTGKLPDEKSVASDHLINSPESDIQHGDNSDWVIVKKQRVTILVPPAPHSERSLTENQGPTDLHLMAPDIANSLEKLPKETSTVHPSGNEHEKTNLLAPQKEIQAVKRGPLPLAKLTVAKPVRIDQRMESENLQQASILKSHNLLGVYEASKGIKQPRKLLATRRSLNLVTSLNQGLRASNLERKLERAGGLSKWLTSLGLEQFVRIFQGRSLNKYYLANLTMKKLKDMGASAVGPRRKLIHAIECVCQPYCFQAL